MKNRNTEIDFNYVCLTAIIFNVSVSTRMSIRSDDVTESDKAVI